LEVSHFAMPPLAIAKNYIGAPLDSLPYAKTAKVCHKLYAYTGFGALKLTNFDRLLALQAQI